MDALELTPPATGRHQKRVPIDPTPRFKPDVHQQSDVIWGHLDSQVDDKHLARAIWEITQRFDVSALEVKYSALGQRGYPPRRLLALWLYASLMGEHEASKVCERTKTDAAFRWICGGRAPSVATLKRFRQSGGELFLVALATTIEMAVELDLVDVRDLAVDSVKLRAHASTKAARTLERSLQRLKELRAIDLRTASEVQRAEHARKVEKHEQTVARCRDEERSNIVVTNELAGLMKFPNGASAPGHRVTVTAAGKTSRLVLSVLLDADSNDYGKLVPSVERARAALAAAGHRSEGRFEAAADAGYFSQGDLTAAREASSWLDVVIAPTEKSGRAGKGYFGRDRFQILPDQPPVCPAGRPMGWVHIRPQGGQEWSGTDCRSCTLKSSCTPGKGNRRLTVIPEVEDMRRRFQDPSVRARYNRRIATVEPVFAHILDTMAYRRVTSRHATTVRSEILLKLVAHNVARILSAVRIRLVHFVLDRF